MADYVPPDQLKIIAGYTSSSLADAELLGYLAEAGATAGEVVGALNELNSTEGIGFQAAYETWIASL